MKNVTEEQKVVEGNKIQIKEENSAKVIHSLPQIPKIHKQEFNNFIMQQNHVTDKNHIKLTEDKLIEIIELTTQKVISAYSKPFENQDQLNFDRKIQLEKMEFEKQKYLDEKKEKEEKKHLQRKNLRLKRYGIILAVAGLLGGFITNWYHEETVNERARKDHMIDLIRQDMAKKEAILKLGTNTIGMLRSIDKDVVRRCQNNHPYSLEEQNRLRWNAAQKVADAFASVAYNFNNEVLQKVSNLIIFEDQNVDICSFEGNYDLKILELKRSIYNSAYKSLADDAEKIKLLK